MKKYLFLIFPIYFATRAVLLGIDGNFGFGFILRVILFFISFYWAIQELKKWDRDMEFLKSKKFWKIFIIAFIVGVIIGGVLEYIKLTS